MKLETEKEYREFNRDFYEYISLFLLPKNDRKEISNYVNRDHIALYCLVENLHNLSTNRTTITLSRRNCILSKPYSNNKREVFLSAITFYETVWFPIKKSISEIIEFWTIVEILTRLKKLVKL